MTMPFVTRDVMSDGRPHRFHPSPGFRYLALAFNLAGLAVMFTGRVFIGAVIAFPLAIAYAILEQRATKRLRIREIAELMAAAGLSASERRVALELLTRKYGRGVRSFHAHFPACPSLLVSVQSLAPA